MKSFTDRRDVPDDLTASQYLAVALDSAWQEETEYLGNREDMTRAWELQNEIRRTNGLPELTPKELVEACEHFARKE